MIISADFGCPYEAARRQIQDALPECGPNALEAAYARAYRLLDMGLCVPKVVRRVVAWVRCVKEAV